MQKHNTLNCKLVIKKHPISNAFICFRVIASFAPSHTITMRNALYIKDLATNTTPAALYALCAQLALQQRATAHALITSKPIYTKFLKLTQSK
jgi:capsule polysaccharide modification protein KpsS